MLIERFARFLDNRLARFTVVGTPRFFLAAYELLVVSAITQAVLVLPMRIYFHRAAIVGLPANLLVLPLAGVLLNSAVAAIALSYVYAPVARIAGFITAATLHWTLRCLAALSHLRISLWRIPDPSLTILLLAVAGVAIAVIAVRRKRIAAFAGIALLFLSAGFAAFGRTAPQNEPGKLEITAIDVGQGDALLVVSPDNHSMLIDAGGTIGPIRGEFDFGEDVVSPYLWSRGIDHLDVVVLTHAHGDHIGGLGRMIENFRPKELWVGINPPAAVVRQLYETAAANGVAVRQHIAGEEFSWGGTDVRVLSPPADWHPKSKPMNDDSLALLLTYGNTRALLSGDVERRMERLIATESPQADLLKVAHHGSATSTTPELLQAVHPSFAVISVGYHNSFGHPRPAVLQRLQDAHVKTYRTDMFGAVTFLLDGSKVEAKLANGR